jgi:hypothetical protein
MSINVLRTGADVLRYGASVRVECRDCGSVTIFGPAEFEREFGPGSLGITAKHNECKECGAQMTQLIILRGI